MTLDLVHSTYYLNWIDCVFLSFITLNAFLTTRQLFFLFLFFLAKRHRIGHGPILIWDHKNTKSQLRVKRNYEKKKLEEKKFGEKFWMENQRHNRHSQNGKKLLFLLKTCFWDIGHRWVYISDSERSYYVIKNGFCRGRTCR